MAEYTLTLRGDKGSKLTIEELDNNFLYLQNNGGNGTQGDQGPQGPQGDQGPQGGGSSKDYIRVTLSDMGTTASSDLSFYSSFSNGLSVNGNGIVLSIGKTYHISGTFFIYNVPNEPYSYRMKLGDSYWGVEINLGQHGNPDFSYNLNTFTTLIQPMTTSTFSFWRVGNNTTIPATQGEIVIFEI